MMSASGYITAKGGTVQASVDSQSAQAMVTIAGTFVSTLQIESSANNGVTWGIVSGSSQVTAPGSWTYPVSGLTNVRVRSVNHSRGSAAVSINGLSATQSPVGISVTSASGNFTVAHNLGRAPQICLFEMTSSGQIWLQTPGYDATNLYLVGSAAGVTANARVW